MENQQAIQILTSVTENVLLSYKDHVTVKRALVSLTTPSGPVAPTPTPAANTKPTKTKAAK